MVAHAFYKSKIGWLEIKADPSRVLSIRFLPGTLRTKVKSVDLLILKKAVRELREYFEGERCSFSLKVLPEGTVFQRRVWNELLKVPYGEIVSYGVVAGRIGKKRAVRAVASAIGSNPLGVMIPCHRVIAADGGIAGYAWGISKKRWLLCHEKKNGGHRL